MKKNEVVNTHLRWYSQRFNKFEIIMTNDIQSEFSFINIFINDDIFFSFQVDYSDIHLILQVIDDMSS